MPSKLASVSFEFRSPPREQSSPASQDTEAQGLLVLLGDFSGRTNRGLCEPLNTRRLVRIDTDNRERVLAQFNARLTLSGPSFPEGNVELTFHALEDFHPDSLLTRTPRLKRIMEARRQLQNPATADHGRTALEALLGAANLAPSVSTETASLNPSPESDKDTLSRLLGGSQPTAPQPATPPSQAAQLIQQIVAPHVTQAPAAWQMGALASAELELSRGLNAILHHPAFQALEAAWRGLDLLVRRIESDVIKLCVVDIGLAELNADLQNEPHAPALLGLLRETNPALLIGNYAFGKSAQDLRTLTGLAQIAAQLRAPFVGTAAPQLVGCISFAQTPDPDSWNTALPAEAGEVWTALRNSAAARFCGLAAPRFLARQPYGRKGDAIESFAFEEISGAPVHESFLWGEAGVLCACAIVDGLQSGEASLPDITGGEILELPVHKFTDDGEIAIQPYAEVWLTDRAVDRMRQRGVMPLIGMKNTNAIRLLDLRSVATSPTPLFG